MTDTWYCAENKVIGAIGITQDMIEEQKMPLIEAFSAIGIDLVVTMAENGLSGTATFQKPDGTVMEYYVSDGTNTFYINAVCGQEYTYARQAAPYYRMDDIDVLNMNEIDIRKAGENCWWSYDANSQTMTISGSGTYYGVSREEQIGSGPYSTLIIGAEVSVLDAVVIPYNDNSPSTIVLLHPEDYALTVRNFFYTYNLNTTEKTVDIYTDNDVLRALTIPKKLTVNWHTLDEWEG